MMLEQAYGRRPDPLVGPVAAQGVRRHLYDDPGHQRRDRGSVPERVRGDRVRCLEVAALIREERRDREGDALDLEEVRDVPWRLLPRERDSRGRPRARPANRQGV